METTLLSKVSVDFERVVDELMVRFDSSIPWQNKLKSNVGTVLIDMIAGTFTNNQYYLEFAAREAYLEYAVRRSSIYAITRSLGVKIIRRTPASVLTRFHNSGMFELFIQEGELLSLEGRPFFSPTSFSLKAGQVKDLPIYEGLFKTKEIEVSELGREFPELYLNEAGFIVSENDLRLFVVSPEGKEVEWKRHNGTIFDLNPDSKVFLDSTTSEGDVLIMFGDGRFGQKPDISSKVRIKYVITNGTQGNAGLPGQVVKHEKLDLLKGQTVESVLGGTGVKDPIYYKKYAPYMYASKNRMVSPPDWYSNIALYAGVGDVAILGQRDIAPNDPTWMKVVRVCILPEAGSTWGGVNPNPRSAKWIQFLKWAADKTGCTIQTWNPERVPVNIHVEILIERSENAEQVRLSAEKRIKELFRHSPGTLGKRLAIDDISNAIRMFGDTRVKGIDYVRVIEPMEDIIPQSKLEYVSMRSLNLVVKYSERDQF